MLTDEWRAVGGGNARSRVGPRMAALCCWCTWQVGCRRMGASMPKPNDGGETCWSVLCCITRPGGRVVNKGRHVCKCNTCMLLLRNRTLKLTAWHGREPLLCTLVGYGISYA